MNDDTPSCSTMDGFLGSATTKLRPHWIRPRRNSPEDLADTGDAIQWGGRHLCTGGDFPTPDGRARFTPLTPTRPDLPAGSFQLATRRGKQFNSMIFAETDPLTGAGRDALFIDETDAATLGVAAGDRVLVRSAVGEMEATVHPVRLPAGTVQVLWPEGNVLLHHSPEHREPGSQVPDYNAVVTVVPRSQSATRSVSS
jgi:anaerobic selenocysteine-containing dehydrogenase